MHYSFAKEPEESGVASLASPHALRTRHVRPACVPPSAQDADADLLWIARDMANEATLPPGWSMYLHADSGRHFYAKAGTGKSVWEHPNMPFYRMALYMERDGWDQVKASFVTMQTSQSSAKLTREAASVAAIRDLFHRCLAYPQKELQRSAPVPDELAAMYDYLELDPGEGEGRIWADAARGVACMQGWPQPTRKTPRPVCGFSDPYVLEVAKFARVAPMPPGWTETEDGDGDPLFTQETTGASQSQHPLDDFFEELIRRRRLELSGAVPAFSRQAADKASGHA